jgi:hypothetical protein
MLQTKNNPWPLYLYGNKKQNTNILNMLQKQIRRSFRSIKLRMKTTANSFSPTNDRKHWKTKFSLIVLHCFFHKGTYLLNISFAYFFTMMQAVYHYQWKFNLSRCVSLSVNSWLVRLCIIISEKLTCHAVYHFQWNVNLSHCVSLSVKIYHAVYQFKWKM